MKFEKIKELLGNKHSVKDIKKAIAKIKPSDVKSNIKKNKEGNSIIELIKSKLT